MSVLDDRRYIAEKLADVPSCCLRDSDWFDTLAAIVGVKVRSCRTSEDVEDYRREVFDALSDLIMPLNTVWAAVRGDIDVIATYADKDDCVSEIKTAENDGEIGYRTAAFSLW